MRIVQKPDRLELKLDAMEQRLLWITLARLAKDYGRPSEEIDPATRSVWYSAKGCQTAGLSKEETYDWLQQLRQVRGERLAHLERWIDQLGKPSAKAGGNLQLSRETAYLLATILNDRRLQAAAQSQLSEKQLERRDPLEWETLTAEQQSALFELDFWGTAIEVIMRWLTPSLESSGPSDDSEASDSI